MSRVIRGGGGRPRVVPREVVDARAEAERIVAEARAEAERIVAEARAEADAVRRGAEQQGLEAARTEAAALLVQARRERDRLLQEAEQGLPAVASEVARRIVAEELRLAPEHVRAVVAQALEPMRRAERLELRVHPQDVPLLGQLPPNVEVVPDEGLQRGGCTVHSERGAVDARIEVRLEALLRALQGGP